MELKKSKLLEVEWFYVNFVRWRPLHKTEKIYDFVGSSSVKMQPWLSELYQSW